MCATKTIELQVEIFVTTKVGKGTPFKKHITKAIELTSKFIEDNAKSREQKITSCMRKKAVSPNFKAHQLGLAGPK